MKKRLFIAVLIPAVIQKKIQETIFPIVVPFKEELKIVARENLHFTVRFLGGWPEEKIPELVETLKPLSREKVFEIQLEKAGFFKNRVLWLGIQQGKIELQEKNQMIIQCLHVKPEESKGHVTLARNKTLSTKQLKELAEKINGLSFQETFLVQEIVLLESQLKPDGPVYKKVFEWKLVS